MRVILVIVLTWMLSACSKQGGQQGAAGGGMPPTPVETVKAEARQLSSRLDAVGSLRALESVSVRPEVAGKLVRIHVSEGQYVAAGSVLFALDAEIARAEVKEAQAAVHASERNRPRIIELASRQLLSKSDADTALATAEINNAKLASARARLAKMEIRAPFEGVIGLRQVSVGEYVSAGQALVELVRLDPLEVEFQVPETQAARLSVGQSVTVQTDAVPGESFTGRLSAIAPSVQVSGRSVAVRARLANAERKLKPGQFAQVQVALNAAQPVLMIPEQAIWPNGDQSAVYRIKAGKAEMVPVTLGGREPGWVAVIAGLVADDEVVTAGQQKLFPGAPVVIGKAAASQ